MADKDQIEEIKDKLDIVSVIQEYVPAMKKSGSNYFALCPFHNEKSPSFSINPELGIFKCFGCGESGDVISFYEKIEGLDFPHALDLAAKKAGLTLTRIEDPKYQKYKEEKLRALSAYKLTGEYYHYLLMKHKKGSEARDYLKKRKLTKEVVTLYQLGYAPNGFENLKNFLVKKGYKLNELVSWGLLVSKNNKIYDKFRNRLMFSILDHQGDLIAFSGRKLSEDDFGPKYLNSPDTIVYKKSKTLFGLYQAKNSIRKNNFAILVEGNVDPLSSHRVGVENILAPLGTAITGDQMKLIRRYCDQVYFAFDSDAAGKKALFRGLELSENIGLQSKVIDIGDYQDVDDFIVAGNDWKKRVEKALPVIDFLLIKLKEDYDLKETKEKLKYCKVILAFINKISNNLEREDYLEKLSFHAKVDKDTLRKEFDKPSNKKGIEKELDKRKKHEKDKTDFNDIDYLLALMLQHKNWLQSLSIKGFKPGIQDEDYLDLISKLIEGKKIDKMMQKEKFRDLSMRQIDSFVSEQEFEYAVKSIQKRLNRKYYVEEINKLSFDSSDPVNLKLINKYTKELSKFS